jgi:hypothetical protein
VGMNARTRTGKFILFALLSTLASVLWILGCPAHSDPPASLGAPAPAPRVASSPLGALAVGNTAVNGTIGGLTAAQTVDNYGSFVLTQTTAGVTATLPNPTSLGAGREAVVSLKAASSTSLIMYGNTMTAGTTLLFQWDGVQWSGAPPASGGAVPSAVLDLPGLFAASNIGVRAAVSSSNGVLYRYSKAITFDRIEAVWLNNTAGPENVTLTAWDATTLGKLATVTVSAPVMGAPSTITGAITPFTTTVGQKIFFTTFGVGALPGGAYYHVATVSQVVTLSGSYVAWTIGSLATAPGEFMLAANWYAGSTTTDSCPNSQSANETYGVRGKQVGEP